jgi:hypothetical protein
MVSLGRVLSCPGVRRIAAPPGLTDAIPIGIVKGSASKVGRPRANWGKTEEQKQPTENPCQTRAFGTPRSASALFQVVSVVPIEIFKKSLTRAANWQYIANGSVLPLRKFRSAG